MTRPAEPVILGVDPSFTHFGWLAIALRGAPVLAAGVIRTQPDRERASWVEDNLRRTRHIGRSLRSLFNRFDVRVVCAESYQHVRSSSASAKVALAWATLINVSDERRHTPLLMQSPKAIKLHVAGDPGASKPDVACEVRKVLGDLDPMLERADVRPDAYEHVYDAAAAALTCMTDDVVRALRRAA